MPNPTVILASSTSLLHLMPFLARNCGDRTKSFDSFERRREEQSHSRSWKRRTGQRLESKENQAAASQRDSPTCEHRQQDRADKGLLALSAASSSLQSLHKWSPFSESSYWLSCLVRLQSRKPQREVDLLKFSTRSQASLSSQQASKRPGPPAVLCDPGPPCWGCPRQPLHTGLTRGSFGVFSINLQICPTHLLCHKRRKQTKSTPSICSQLQWSNSVIQDIKELKARQIWPPNTFSLLLQKDP